MPRPVTTYPIGADHKFPANVAIGAEQQGGRFASQGMIRAAKVPIGAYRVGGPFATYTSFFRPILTGMNIRCWAMNQETAEKVLVRSRELIHEMDAYDTGWMYEKAEVVPLDIIGDWSVQYEAEYAPYVHFGSMHNKPPKPFLTDAINESKTEHVARIAAALRSV